MESQIDKKMENYMEAREYEGVILRVYWGCIEIIEIMGNKMETTM